MRRVAFALAGAASVTLVIACNALIGLNDYERVECTGGTCDGGTFDGGPDSSSSDGSTADVTSVDAAGAAPVSWAHFLMPNYPLDGGPDANLASYKVSPDLVLDNVTGRAWREPIPDGEKGLRTFAEAKQLCASAGQWRLPSRIELVTLLDLSQSPAVDHATFPSTEGIEYWTSSEVRPYGTNGYMRWTVQFGGTPGLDQQDETSGRAGVRCIKNQ
jgi:hypothetical protein